MTDRDDGEIEIEIEREGSTDERTEPAVGDDDSVDDSADRLADELGRVHLRTTPEGYVEGRVTDLESTDATTVWLAVELPHGERVTFDLEKPIPWSQEFLLARIVEDVGYDASSIDHLVGESVYLVRTDVGEDADDATDWWTLSVRTAGNAMLASLSDHLRLEDERGPEWRLVDPLERPAPPEDGLSDDLLATAALGLALLGPVVAAAGAAVGLTGGVVVSSAVVGAMLAGLALTLLGVAIRTSLEEKP
ncbi:hypothetical protein [Natrononativus amylolyticus]|uniref:hypothetical protein n=1 Tax=Natrononativus amylolyticus TaxID=2963434 RepID=UPI0020CD5E48|nr:hypothetical protein [Natrononativus amylolyticus]